MNIFRIITPALSLALLAIGAVQPQVASAQTQPQRVMLAAKAKCGGVNQNSCWSANPKKWCNAGLQYIPGGLGRRGKCIKVAERVRDTGGDPTPNCGGIGQKSCWSLSSKKWCDAGLLYKPGVLPGKGRCEAPKSGDILDQTRAMASRFASLDKDNELARLRRCVNSPKIKARMIAAMQKQSAMSTNTILRECNISVQKLEDVADTVLGESSQSARRMSYGSDQANPPDVGPPVDDDEEVSVADKYRLFFEVSAGAAAGSKGRDFTLGYAIPLHSKAGFSRWYKNDTDYDSGFDLGVGGDIFVGLGKPGVPSGDYVTESGTSGVYAIAALAKLGVLGRQTFDGKMAFGLFGGIGLGLTVAKYDYTNEFFYDLGGDR
ncbi:hypothetical protein [Sphingorhabdus sp. SMR4y]|uniref:hypothetical protein n=1 Tax=Sphingorhabdus sp. SMR4y TaxID=2584094 RepID=UPI000B5C7974|nr:hypothetical protein [Sphingorhabdus sp. SMR4y]ASK89301.1 hypothetical protein SPHFLASMR4Y_02563 [Sphingorhabdus sp. SMR4y]